MLAPALNTSISLRHTSMRLFITSIGGLGNFPVSDHMWRLIPYEPDRVSIVTHISGEYYDIRVSSDNKIQLSPLCENSYGGFTVGRTADISIVLKVDEKRYFVPGSRVSCPVDSCTSPILEPTVSENGGKNATKTWTWVHRNWKTRATMVTTILNDISYHRDTFSLVSGRASESKGGVAICMTMTEPQAPTDTASHRESTPFASTFCTFARLFLKNHDDF